MICKFCLIEETDDLDSICDDCMICIISDNNVPPHF